MLGATPEGYFGLTEGSDTWTITPNLLQNLPQGLLALAGNDTVLGSEIADVIKGNQGKDNLFGNAGNDFIQGDLEYDLINGGEGDDSLFGGLDTDVLFGDLGQDFLYGGQDRDLFFLQLDAIVTNANVADLIADFEIGQDFIAIPKDLTLERFTLQPVEDGTLIQDTITGGILGKVLGVSTQDLQGVFINSLPAPLSPPPADTAGENLAQVRDLGALNSVQVLNEFVGDFDIFDVYRFELPTQSNFSLQLNVNTLDNTADADVYIVQEINGDGDIDKIVDSSTEPGNSSETINLNALYAGEYFVIVAPHEGNIDYTLEVSATPDLTPPQALPPSSIANYNPYFGWGLVDASAAVARAAGLSTTYTEVDYENIIENLSSPNNFRDLNSIKVPEVWNQGYTGQGVVVAVLDDGVEMNHPVLITNIANNPLEVNGQPGIDDDNNGYIDDGFGYDFVDNDNNANPELNETGFYDAHGTQVSGIIAGLNNGVTVDQFDRLYNFTGVAYNAKIMPVRVYGDSIDTDVTIPQGIRYAVDNGAKIINISIGQPGSDLQQVPRPEIQQALEYAKQKGVTVVLSAGNEREDFAEGQVTQPTYFSRYSAQDLAIAVGAIDSSNRQFASFSNPAGVQPSDFVAAPGVNGLSTLPNNFYGGFDGTSMAAPYVAGVVALMLEANPTLTPDQISDIVTQTANPNGITGIQVFTVIPPS